MSDILMQALMGATEREAQNNPWLRGAAGIQQQDYSGYDMKPWQKVLLSAISGFGGGAMRGYGESQVKQKLGERTGAVMQGLKSGKVLDALMADPQMAESAPLYEIEQQTQKASRLHELNKALLPKGMMLGEDNKVNQIFDPAEDKAREAGLVKAAELQAGRDSAGLSSRDFQIPTLAETKGQFGQYNTTKQKRNSLIQEGLQQGLTPNAAAEYAERNLRSSTVMTKNAIEKLEAARKQASGLMDVANKAEYGMQGAGATGGLLNAPRELFSKAYSLISPEETAQRAAQAELDSVKPSIISFAKTPGSGAMSDVEMKVYLGAGPGSDKTPEENARIIDGIKASAQVSKDYADFLEAYIEDKGDAVGADVAWSQYKEANPLIVRDEAGNLNRNSQRTPWQEYFGLGNESSGPSGVMGEGETTQPETPAPPPGFEIIGVNPQTGKYQLRRVQ